MATLKEVAQLVGVSTATVSYVLNNKSNKVSKDVTDKVWKAVKELNYQPNLTARALRSNKSRIIAVLSEDITSYQVNNIVKGINQVANEQKYQIILGDLGLSEKIWNGKKQDYSKVVEYSDEIQNNLAIFKTAGVGGVIYVGMHNRDVTGLLHTEIPLVYSYCYTNKETDIAIDCDNQMVSATLVRQMIEKGHKRIGLISGPVDSVPAYKRLMGYQTSLMNGFIPMDPQLVTYGNWSDTSGYEACKQLFTVDNPPTAIFCMNDWMALGAYKFLKEKDIKIPQDVEIVGFDDIDLCQYMEPKLTSVEMPLAEIGREAAEIMIKIMEEGKVDSYNKELKCRIKERESFQHS